MLRVFTVAALLLSVARCDKKPPVTDRRTGSPLPDVPRMRKDARQHYFDSVTVNTTKVRAVDSYAMNEVAPWPAESATYIVADLHGDFLVSSSILYALGVIDGTGTWSAGKSKLIQLGDIVDRGPDSPAIYELFWRLREEARNEGGELTMLFGNHEVMNLLNHTHYLSPKEIDKYYRAQSPASVWNPLSGYLGRNVLAASQPVHQLGDVVFVHAGLILPFAAQSNAKLRADMTAAIIAAASGNKRKSAKYRELMEGDHSPIWTRVLSNGRNESLLCTWLSNAMEGRNATKQIVGHTPTRTHLIETKCQGAYIMADTGSSRWMGGGHTALRVTVDSIAYNNDTDAYQALRVWHQVVITRLPDFKERRNTPMDFTSRVLLTDTVCYTDASGTNQRLCPQVETAKEISSEL